MKNYLVKTCSIIAFAIMASVPDMALSKVRDPFSPTNGVTVVKSVSVTTDAENEQITVGDNPITSSKLSNFKIIGVISSDKVKIASVKSISGIDYIVKNGDRFGSEGGRITDITAKGVKVEIDGKASFLPVNNKIEVNVEE